MLLHRLSSVLLFDLKKTGLVRLVLLPAPNENIFMIMHNFENVSTGNEIYR
jgi:hypothetical protein